MPVNFRVYSSTVKLLPFLLLCLLAPTFVVKAETAANCVILLHGMARSSGSMSEIEDALLEQGYVVVNVDYPSTAYSIQFLAENFIPPALKQCEASGATTINFVTHSLGGILVRYLLQDHHLKGLDKIVMLSPPNHGSEVTDTLKDWALYSWVMGKPGQQLGTAKDAMPNTLKPIPGQIGIITGNVSYDPWFSGILPGPDDGKVTVESARLEEMKDFLIVESGHAFIMTNDQVVAQILFFMKHGRFDR